MRQSASFTVAIAAAITLTLGAPSAFASPQQWKDMLEKAVDASPDSHALADSEVASGLKEALAHGVTHAIKTLGRKGGFSDNAKVRIPLPDTLRQVGKLARMAGQGDKVDAFKLSLNRAAEKAVPQVADILGEAVRKMTIKDAQQILTGGDHAATDYFRRVAGKQLTTRIEPIVSKATDSVGVTRKYKALVSDSSDGALGGVLSQLGGDSGHGSLSLDDYVTDKAIDGLFAEIAQQEKAIRENPAARTTDLLKKVFSHQ
ncbi:MAG TPA: DUF4197 domain-containing protein [Oleiagrimonas sp.]|nr:DUF4197 domain-containing protein [Oleiagrimonas sp.]